jgi:hypothetical protein
MPPFTILAWSTFHHEFPKIFLSSEAIPTGKRSRWDHPWFWHWVHHCLWGPWPISRQERSNRFCSSANSLNQGQIITIEVYDSLWVWWNVFFSDGSSTNNGTLSSKRSFAWIWWRCSHSNQSAGRVSSQTSQVPTSVPFPPPRTQHGSRDYGAYAMPVRDVGTRDSHKMPS